MNFSVNVPMLIWAMLPQTKYLVLIIVRVAGPSRVLYPFSILRFLFGKFGGYKQADHLPYSSCIIAFEPFSAY